MRTTVALDPDVQRAVDDLRRSEGLSTSAALNTLARQGLAAAPKGGQKPFVQTVSGLGAPTVPLDDIATVLDLIEGEHRG